MNSKLLGFLLLSLLVVCLACKPNQSSKKWYKGNLHTHSYWSDGDEFPEMIMDWYKSNGYHFVALSDHNTLARGERWIRIQENPISEGSLEGYLNKYGDEWVEYKKDSNHTEVRLKTLTNTGRYLKSLTNFSSSSRRKLPTVLTVSHYT